MKVVIKGIGNLDINKNDEIISLRNFSSYHPCIKEKFYMEEGDVLKVKSINFTHELFKLKYKFKFHRKRDDKIIQFTLDSSNESHTFFTHFNITSIKRNTEILKLL